MQGRGGGEEEIVLVAFNVEGAEQGPPQLLMPMGGTFADFFEADNWMDAGAILDSAPDLYVLIESCAFSSRAVQSFKSVSLVRRYWDLVRRVVALGAQALLEESSHSGDLPVDSGDGPPIGSLLGLVVEADTWSEARAAVERYPQLIHPAFDETVEKLLRTEAYRPDRVHAKIQALLVRRRAREIGVPLAFAEASLNATVAGMPSDPAGLPAAIWLLGRQDTPAGWLACLAEYPQLLSDAADLMIDRMLSVCRSEGAEEMLASLGQQKQYLRRCRQLGPTEAVAPMAALAEIEEPERLRLLDSLGELIGQRTVSGTTRLLKDHPEVLSPAATALLIMYWALSQANDEEPDLIWDAISLVESAQKFGVSVACAEASLRATIDGAAIDPDGLSGMCWLWAQAGTPDEMRNILAKYPNVLSPDVDPVLERLIACAIAGDAETAGSLAQHLAILRRCRSVGTERAMSEQAEFHAWVAQHPNEFHPMVETIGQLLKTPSLGERREFISQRPALLAPWMEGMMGRLLGAGVAAGADVTLLQEHWEFLRRASEAGVDEALVDAITPKILQGLGDSELELARAFVRTMPVRNEAALLPVLREYPALARPDLDQLVEHILSIERPPGDQPLRYAIQRRWSQIRKCWVLGSDAPPLGNLSLSDGLPDDALSALAAVEHLVDAIQPAANEVDVHLLIEPLRRAAELTFPRSANRGQILILLAQVLLIRFERARDRNDLDDAVETLRTAADGYPEDHPTQAVRLAWLGSALRRRAELYGDARDLDASIANLERALIVSDRGRRADVLPMAAKGLLQLYKSGRDEAVLHRAESLAAEATESAIEAAQRSDALAVAGLCWIEEYELDGDLDTLNRAIRALTRSLLWAGPERERLADRYTNLAGCLRSRYGVTYRIADLDLAISYFQRVLDISPEEGAERSGSLANLGNVLLERFEITGLGR